MMDFDVSQWFRAANDGGRGSALLSRIAEEFFSLVQGGSPRDATKPDPARVLPALRRQLMELELNDSELEVGFHALRLYLRKTGTHITDVCYGPGEDAAPDQPYRVVIYFKNESIPYQPIRERIRKVVAHFLEMNFTPDGRELADGLEIVGISRLQRQRFNTVS